MKRPKSIKRIQWEARDASPEFKNKTIINHTSNRVSRSHAASIIKNSNSMNCSINLNSSFLMCLK